MNENFTENQITQNTNRFVKIYKENKIIIYLIVFIFSITTASIAFYLNAAEKKKIFISDEYLKAKIYIKEKKHDDAKKILKEIILSKNNTYSTLSLFLIIDEKLIVDNEEILELFEKILENNKLKKEIKNLIIFKKALFMSDFTNENELLTSINPLIIGKSIWKPHAIILLGDFYVNKKEYIKARDFYTEILNMKNLRKETYEHAISQLLFISKK